MTQLLQPCAWLAAGAPNTLNPMIQRSTLEKTDLIQCELWDNVLDHVESLYGTCSGFFHTGLFLGFQKAHPRAVRRVSTGLGDGIATELSISNFFCVCFDPRMCNLAWCFWVHVVN